MCFQNSTLLKTNSLMISFPKASSHITNCKLLTRDTWCFAETWDALPGSTRKIEFCFIFPVDNGSCR